MVLQHEVPSNLILFSGSDSRVQYTVEYSTDKVFLGEECKIGSRQKILIDGVNGIRFVILGFGS